MTAEGAVVPDPSTWPKWKADNPTIVREAPIYITIKEAAFEFDKTVWEVVELAESGAIGSVRYGRLALVSATELEALR